MRIRSRKRTLLNPLIVAVCITFVWSSGLAAQNRMWQPAPPHLQMPIWPGAAPDARPVQPPETVETNTEEPVAGRPWISVSNVSRPTITVYSPKEKNTGAAFVVFPGGGYKLLAIDLEGTEI